MEGAEEISTLETTYDSMAFALVLAEHRLKRPQAKLSTTFDLVIGDLEKKYNIVTNGEQCRDRRKKLDESFRAKIKNTITLREILVGPK